MIVTHIVGGLGNQLFQYATGKALARQHNTELLLDVSAFKLYYEVQSYTLDHFNIPQNVYKRSRLTRKICTLLTHNPYYPLHYYKEEGAAFDPKVYVRCEQAYYQAAYQKMQNALKDPIFFIFSDDIDWAKENLKFIDSAVFIDDPLRANYEDFHLMRSCKHNVTANSTFSWWAAWCNINPDKMVITPKEWFLVSKLPSGYELALKDLIPASWIKI